MPAKKREPEWQPPSEEQLAVLKRQIAAGIDEGEAIMATTTEVSWGPWQTGLGNLIEVALGKDPWGNSFHWSGASFGGMDTRYMSAGERTRVRVKERNESMEAKLAVARKALAAIDQELERRGAAPAEGTALPAEGFAFVTSAPLKVIAQRDYEELRSATRTVKARALLAGSVLEAVLMDALERNGFTAAQTDRMSFHELITEAEQAKLIQPRTARAAQSLRDFRNLVHPAVERRDGRLRAAEADAAVSLMRLALEDLR